MKYLLLIYYNEDDLAEPGSSARHEEFEAYLQLNASLQEGGAALAGEALQSIATATTVRVRDDDLLLTDGPFAETKEQLGGFYMIEAEDLDEAIGYAARIPAAAYGSIEVRPIWDWTQGEA